MKYFIDQEFQEDFHKPLFGKRRHFIDLISIGIVGEDGSEFYAISKDFDIDSVWKNEWLCDNVLKEIYREETKKDWDRFKYQPGYTGYPSHFSKRNFRRLINAVGRTNKEIMCDIILYLYRDTYSDWMDGTAEFIERGIKFGWGEDLNHEFYGYYGDYDWVLFCSLFGKMINLPYGFPMYLKDLKQMLDEKAQSMTFSNIGRRAVMGFEDALRVLKEDKKYPSQKNEHNALSDAKWDRDLYDYLTINK